MIQPNKNKAKSYDDKFLDLVAESDLYKNWSSNKNKTKLATTNAFDTEQHRINFDSSNQDYLDEGINPFLNQFVDLQAEDPFNELRASRQGGWSELGLFGSRAIAKTGREIINTAGAIGGLVPAIAGQLEDAYTGEDKTTFLQTVFDNAFIKANNEMFDKLNKEFLPVYVSDTVTNGGFTDKIFSGEFWATEGADGVGYLVSMLAPGAALKSLKVGNGIFNTAAKLTALKNGKSIATAQRALEMAGWSGQKVDSFIIPAFNTLAEAGAEARGFSDNLRANKTEALANIFNSEDFRNTKNSKLQELGQQYMSKAITQEEYESRVNNLDFEISEQMFEDQVSSGMTNTFLKNVVALAGPNYIQSKILYGNNGARNLLNQVTKKPVTQGIKRVGKSFLSEGSEEVAQTAIEHRNLEMGKKGLLGKSIVDDYNPITFGEDFIKTLGTTEGQVAGFLGGVLGSPISVIGGYIQDKKDIVRDKSARDKILLAGTSLNDIHLPIYETEIVYNYNNEPTEVRKKDENGNDILIPENVAKIKKALDFHEELSQVFDVAVEAGNTEIVNKLKEIGEQNLIMNFVGEDEMTIDAFKEHLKVTLPTENVEKSVAEENLKRQHDLLEKAKHVRKEMISFNNMVPKFIKLNNETATENQTKSFMNDLQRSFINDSVELRELEKKKSELESENADLEKFTKVEEIDNPNYVEGKSHELDKKTTKRTNPRLDKNNEELEKINKQIENNKKFINEEIWDNDFINKRFEDFLKEAKQIEKETSPEVVANNDTVLEQIDNATSHKELDDIKSDNKIIQNKINDRKKELQEEELKKREAEIQSQKESENLENETNSLDLELLKESSKDVKKGETFLNPLTNEVETVDDITKDSITLNGKVYEFEPELTDDNSSTDVEIKSINAVPEGTSKTDAKTPGVGNKEYTNYLQEIRNKKGDVVTFELNLNNLNNDTKKAIEIYESNQIAEHRDFLINNLPITFVYNGKVKSFSAFPSKHPSALIIRTNIIDILSQGYKLEDLSTVVSNQEVADFNNKKDAEGNPLKNNVLEIDYIKNELSKDTSKMTLYHIDKGGKAVLVTDSKDTLDVTIKSRLENQKGQIFLVIKNYKGDNIPVKLNFNRLDNVKASSLARLYSEVLKNQDLLNQPLKALDLNEETKDLYNELIKTFESELKLLNKSNPQLTNVNELIEVLVFENSFNDKKIVRKLDDNENPYIEYNNKEYYLNSVEEIEELANDLQSKFHNVVTITTDQNVNKSLNFQNPDYLQYLFENKILTTDLDIENGSFVVTSGNGKQGSELWVDSSIVVKNQKPSKPTTISKPQQSDIEAKKADIERRRQEEFIYSNDINKWVKNEDGTFTVGTIKYAPNDLQNIPEDAKVIDSMDTSEFEWQIIKLEDDELTYAGELTDIINAKYDAELKALESGNNSENNVQIIEYNSNSYSVDLDKGTIKNTKTGKEIQGSSPVGKKVLDLVNWDVENNLEKINNTQENLENNVQTKESFIEEKLKPFKDKIKEITKGLEADESVKGPFYGVGSKSGNMIKLSTEVEYTQEGIITKGVLMPYKQLFSDVYGKSLENIWNSQKNSVSLQNKPKIVNKMEVKGTEENKELNEAYKDLTENDLSKKQKELSDILEKNQKALSSSKNEILNKRLEDIISKTQTELNSVVEEIKKRKKC